MLLIHGSSKSFVSRSEELWENNTISNNQYEARETKLWGFVIKKQDKIEDKLYGFCQNADKIAVQCYF